jgi:N-acetylgalactosamine-N,N'-diacetylbacillosaminyl-diphospho-undecaprenol 4-alpha-N-acetylgalactosaminyltransferase
MHFVIVIDDLGEGGAERAAHNLSNYLIREKFEVTFILLKNYIIYPVHKDIKVISLVENFTKIDRRLVTPLFYFQLKKILKQYEPTSTCIISYNNVSIFLLGLFKRYHPQYICLMSLQFSFRHYASSFIKEWIIKPIMLRIYSYYDHILVVSEMIKDEIGQYNLNSKISVLVNPVDTKTVVKKSLEECVIEDKASFRFVNIGRFHHQKNHELLIKAFALIKNSDVRLYLVGQGQLEKELKTLCIELGVENQVHFVGLQLNPFKFLKQSDCFVLSSNFEGFPNVLVEAMACGLPIISTDCPTGPREILAPKTLNNNIVLQKGEVDYAEHGILVPLDDVNALSKAMQAVLDNVDIKEKYAHKGFVRAQDFDINVIFSHLSQISKEIFLIR